MRRFIYAFILILGIPIHILGAKSVAGKTGMAFLKIGVGGRAIGMAEAYTAVANDASATYWNPAGLAVLNKVELTFTHNRWLQDVSHNFFAIAFIKGKHHFGLSFISNNVEGIEHRVKPSAEPLGMVEAHDIAVGLSYARNIGERLRIGLTLKYLYERIFIESAPGVAIDLGCIYSPAWLTGLQFGLAAQNFGKMTKLKEKTIKLPQTIRLGAAYFIPKKLAGGQFLLAADAIKILDGNLHANFGCEFYFKQIFSLRGGYQTGWEEKGLNAGFGFAYARYALDYGYTPFSFDLGNSHRISFSVKL